MIKINDELYVNFYNIVMIESEEYYDCNFRVAGYNIYITLKNKEHRKNYGFFKTKEKAEEELEKLITRINNWSKNIL